jgi:hypothetical protein
MTAPNNYGFPNYSATQAETDGITTVEGTAGVLDGDTASLVFNDVTTASEANTQAIPSNPTSPSVPSTGVAQTNTNPYAVQVSIAGGTVTHVKVNGTATGLTSGTFIVPSGGTIAITYSGAPTWVWTNAGGEVGYAEAVVDGSAVKVPYAGF